jgi:hypothetical protein
VFLIEVVHNEIGFEFNVFVGLRKLVVAYLLMGGAPAVANQPLRNREAISQGPAVSLC